MAQDNLEPITPEEAIDWYLEHRQDELRAATLEGVGALDYRQGQ